MKDQTVQHLIDTQNARVGSNILYKEPMLCHQFCVNMARSIVDHVIPFPGIYGLDILCSLIEEPICEADVLSQ